jgi:hypothetical protein
MIGRAALFLDPLQCGLSPLSAANRFANRFANHCHNPDFGDVQGQSTQRLTAAKSTT